ncbi:TAXI family TRAP transporter solute-binding subunit [Methylobacterium nigriterrae]|uniref:TAXI family TRAP transporter solute-binding subunit n=1 Tax=Methylobacterium nigriterrae TaxID=3127512 RepID=UPI003013F073
MLAAQPTVSAARTARPASRFVKRRTSPLTPVPERVQTVTLVAGEPGSTALDIAADMASALDDERLRVAVLLGRGGERNITDVLRTRGVDMGVIATADLRQAEQSGVNKRVVYIAKLNNAELHILTRREIRHITDLDGQAINLGEVDSSTQTVARAVLNHLGIRFTEANLGQREATAQLKAGGLVASFFLTGKPASLYGESHRGSGLHFLSVPYEPGLGDAYYPATLDREDYPDLIAEGESVDTVAVASALVAFDWPEASERYRRLQAFTVALFDRFERLREPGRHAKWREVNLAAILPGWRRFKPAQEALDRRAGASGSVMPAAAAVRPAEPAAVRGRAGLSGLQDISGPPEGGR